jgi:uncharacterized protein (DUF486 family)
MQVVIKYGRFILLFTEKYKRRGGYKKMSRLLPVALLVGSNIFMTYAWYGHLKDFRTRPIITVIFISWGIALMEYCLQVPANRIGSGYFSLPQLKVMQEVITMAVFAAFCMIYMKQKLTLDYLWASLCLIAAAYFLFRHIQST